MKKLRFAVLGCGFWSQFQIAAWKELEGAELVALFNRTRSKAEALAERFDVPTVYDDAEELLGKEQLDFVDIITDVDTHPRFVELAAAKGIAVICQKPMAANLESAERIVAACRDASVPLMIHENWRWQYPIRQFAKALAESELGKCFRARVQFSCSFPVFDNQPFLAELEQFILTDIGSHILDTARFLFGDASNLYCQTSSVNPKIRGEDVATVMMQMGHGTTVTCEMSYASRMEHERFPETYVVAECENGSVELGPDFWIRTTTADGTTAERHAPHHYDWADSAYDVVHSSILPCNADILRSLQAGIPAETSGDDNIKTVRLVFASYESAASGRVISLNCSG